jgi:glycosyltransferase involved in cell wall biosynthesis
MVLAMGDASVWPRASPASEVVINGAGAPADVPALGAALERLISNPALRRTLGDAAAAFVRPRFGVDGYIAAVTGLYDRLLAAERPGRA